MSDQHHDAAAEELYRHRHDPGEWEAEEEQIDVRPARTSVVSFRVPTPELDQLERAAQAAGQTLSVYIRTAITQHLSQGSATLPVTFNISFGIRYIMQHDIWQTWSNAPASTTQELKLTA